MADEEIRFLSSVSMLAKNGDLGAFYKQGPQGNSIADYRADFRRRYGHVKGEINSTVEDIRDNRDPATVGAEFLAQRDKERRSKKNGKSNGKGIHVSE